ncbi:F-box/LRR-repeat protein At1g55660 isoform X3 [Glycine max]|uniref:F-box/LRR-repeat protein At1g55660 isoform X3 n=1 Tax=Glycine max TaxID=3847 RepID=UPI001B355B12|nr:F-box/LRR-repeat protein At1g55660 isoform X3 [Glycine max]
MRLQQRFGTKFSVLVLEKCRLKLLNGFWENDRCDMPKTCLITRLLSLRWWKHIWVAVHPHTIENLSFISQLVSMEEGKETKGKLTTEPKIQRTSEEERDRLSELPDFVLLHIMNFIDTKDALRTCILSKRWKDLWKHLTTLSFYQSSSLFNERVVNFNKFVSQVLSCRDGSISLINVRLVIYESIGSQLLNRIMKYAVLHNVQQLTMYIPFYYGKISTYLDPIIFSCQSLTYLSLHNLSSRPPLELPKSLQLPALKSLCLINVLFTATDNVCAEPFTTCNLLNTLVLKYCFLHNDAKILFISNSNLSSLKLMDLKIRDTFQHKVVLSTPNLSSLTVCFFEASSFTIQPLSSTCNLSCLEEGTINIATDISHPVLLGWLQVFTNVKILTLSYGTLKLILKNPSLLVLPITIEAKLDQAWSGITIINTIREAYDLHVMGILCDAY